MPVYLPQKFGCLLAGRQQRGGTHQNANAGNRQSGLSMGYQQNNRTAENHTAGRKGFFAFDRLTGIRTGCRIQRALRSELLTEAKIEIRNRCNHGNQGNQAGIDNEIAEGISQRGSDDDIGRISAHGSGTAQIRAENLGQNHRNRVKSQQVRQFHRDRRQKQDHRNTVNKHGENRGEQHEHQKQRNHPIMHLAGKGHTQPTEKSTLRHAFHHDHHTANEENGFPVDSDRRGCFARMVPERWVRNAVETQRLLHGLRTVHAKAKHNRQCQKAAHKRHNMTRNLFHDDQNEHHNKNQNCCNLCHKSPSFSHNQTNQPHQNTNHIPPTPVNNSARTVKFPFASCRNPLRFFIQIATFR